MKKSNEEWYRITVVYKNGVTVEFITDEFTATRRDGSLSAVEWGRIRNDSAKPIHFNVDEVSSIWSKAL